MGGKLFGWYLREVAVFLENLNHSHGTVMFAGGPQGTMQTHFEYPALTSCVSWNQSDSPLCYFSVLISTMGWK